MRRVLGYLPQEFGLYPKISAEVSKNTDLEFAHKTFGDLVKPEKYDNLLKDKNKSNFQHAINNLELN